MVAAAYQSETQGEAQSAERILPVSHFAGVRPDTSVYLDTSGYLA
jgi:hypothetical protein